MEYLFGDLTLRYVISALLFMSVGIAIVKLVRFTRRKKGVVRERKLSFKYWLSDNYAGLLLHTFIALISIRFNSDGLSVIGHLLPIQTSEDPMFIYLLLGLSFQAILDYIQKRIR